MPSNIFWTLLLVLNLITMHYAYRIDSNDEAIQALFRGNDEESLANLYNLKQAEEYNSDNSNFIPCHRLSSYILCKKMDHLSRRDTGFLRFGRKR